MQSSTVKESGKMSSFAFFVHFFPVLLDRKKLRTPSSHVGPGSIFQANQLKIAAFHLCHAANRKKVNTGGKRTDFVFLVNCFQTFFPQFTSCKEGFFFFWHISLLMPSVPDADTCCQVQQPRRPAKKAHLEFW
ncbi:hypothetical protein [Thiolapillus sp.]|uniref:hypothetical protein n=2 Tax=Thiolapillus sp. TaxID=2017437 RepID=UPI0025D58EA2|nr:hypothetical protein [Thiolapillus sp.]